MPLSFNWGDLKAFELRALAERNTTVVLPVASVEQHGPALPVNVDNYLVDEVARRTAVLCEKAGRPILLAPTLRVGLAEHHMPFGGTLTYSWSTYKAVLKDLVSSIIRHGFTRVLLLNGHGGNDTALQNISQELSQELNATVAKASYWTIPSTAAKMSQILTAQPGVLHAGEGESSMTLALHPELVDKDALESLVCPPNEQGMMTVRGVYRWRHFADYTPTGCLGVPSAATAEKGERLFDAAAEGLAEALLAPDEEWEHGSHVYPSPENSWQAFHKAEFDKLFESSTADPQVRADAKLRPKM